MKVIFFGTPHFSAKVLTFLLNNHVNVVAVVSKPDRPQGRSGRAVPTAVKQAALAFDPSIPIYQPETVSTLEFASLLKTYEADLFVVAAYGEIIKESLLLIPKEGCINLHTSLLPKFRGAAPIQRAIIAGEEETGVTIIHMVKKMDAGEMIKKVIVPIDPEMTFALLEEDLCLVGQEALLDVIKNFNLYNESAQKQDKSRVTFAPKIELEECEIQWSDPAKNIHNLIRGVNPEPGAWCYVNVRGERKRLKINRSKVVPINSTLSPGSIINQSSSKGNLIIACGENALELLEVQLEGKKILSSDELTRGIPRKELSFN